METRYGFLMMDMAEFTVWLQDQRISRTVIKIQQHHTYSPSYANFTGSNHFERQRAMQNYHIHNNGWRNIGQHFTIFPDGTILTGRSLEESPACIYGQNAHSICIESLGDFDIGKDQMTNAQRNAIVEATAILCAKFNIPVSTDFIVYHHWFNLSSGHRNNGSGNNKSCPGTNFFGGNKVQDCNVHFLPLVQAVVGSIRLNTSNVSKFVCVNTQTLNVRTAPNASSVLASDRAKVQLGAILRVYGDSNGWLKISNSDSRWVFARYTKEVERAIVSASTLNVRSGSGGNYPKIGSVSRGDVVFVHERSGLWCRIDLEDKWVSSQYLQF